MKVAVGDTSSPSKNDIPLHVPYYPLQLSVEGLGVNTLS